jgi:hypothetical protein
MTEDSKLFQNNLLTTLINYSKTKIARVNYAKTNFKAFQVRLPEELYDQFVKYLKELPYNRSLNSLMVEAAFKFFQEQESNVLNRTLSISHTVQTDRGEPDE